MNEQNNESQPTPNQTQPAQTNQNKPALAGMCQVCGGECNLRNTLCDKCDAVMRGWLRDYPSWIQALSEFLDSTAHYGGHQPGRTNLASAPTPVRLSVIDHLQEIDDLAVALWRRLYAPPAMPWADSRIHPSVLKCLSICTDCNRLSRLPDIGLIWRDWERVVRKTLGIIDVPPSRHGIGRCLNPLCCVNAGSSAMRIRFARGVSVAGFSRPVRTIRDGHCTGFRTCIGRCCGAIRFDKIESATQNCQWIRGFKPR